MMRGLTTTARWEFDLLATSAKRTAYYNDWEKRQSSKRQAGNVKEAPRKKQRVVKCKAEMTMYPQRRRTLPETIADLQDPNLEIEPAVRIKCWRIKLNPSAEQRARLKTYMGTYRFLYNETVALCKNKEQCVEEFGCREPPQQFVREYVLKKAPPWSIQTPFNIRQEACNDYKKAIKTAKVLQGDDFTMKFKSLHRARQVTIPLVKSCIYMTEKGLHLFPTNAGATRIPWKHLDQKLWAQLGTAIQPKASNYGIHPEADCRLVYDRGSRSFALHIPLKEETHWSIVRSENQSSDSNDSSPRVVALDPGVRTFQTAYSPSEQEITEFAPQDIQRLCRLSHGLDKLGERIDDPARTHKSRLQMRRARFRLYDRIKHLRDEVHWKTCDYLCKNYDVILLPDFQSQAMSTKRNAKGEYVRKINRNTTRRMLLWGHYIFRQRLIQKAKQWGKVLVIVNEAYTSKTCTRCGVQNTKLGGSKTFHCNSCDSKCDRDVNGARNILLRNTTMQCNYM
jgi:transposase